MKRGASDPTSVQVERRLSMLQDAHAKCSPNLTADDLDLCSISLPATCYMWEESTLDV